MNLQKYVGLIECNASAVPYDLDETSRQKGFELKKVLMKNRSASSARYPEAEIVQDLNAIINDSSIELVIVNGMENRCLNQVAAVLKAGKQVRLV